MFTDIHSELAKFQWNTLGGLDGPASTAQENNQGRQYQIEYAHAPLGSVFER